MTSTYHIIEIVFITISMGHIDGFDTLSVFSICTVKLQH
jgi:hypothetical protein